MLVAVDTGGTKTLIATFNHDGSPVHEVKFQTPKNKNSYITAVVEAIESLKIGTLDAITVALPGRILKNDTLALARHLGWEDFNVKTALKPHFSCPIFIENDANLAGLAETRQLTVIPSVSLYVTISTGIGTGIITDGIIDPHFTQSEGGRMVFDHNDTLIHWEDFSSGHAIHEKYGRLMKDITNENDLNEIATNISKGLLALSPVFRPEVIIIGGSVGTYFEKYKAPLVAILGQYLHYLPKIIAAKHPEKAVIYGCYYYALDRLAR